MGDSDGFKPVIQKKTTYVFVGAGNAVSSLIQKRRRPLVLHSSSLIRLVKYDTSSDGSQPSNYTQTNREFNVTIVTFHRLP